MAGRRMERSSPNSPSLDFMDTLIGWSGLADTAGLQRGIWAATGAGNRWSAEGVRLAPVELISPRGL